jgi:hypothetical protein
MEDEQLSEIKKLEKEYGATITTLVVCTTGVSPERALDIEEDADVVWGCASREIREMVGPYALLQVSEKIPVFVLTEKGLDVLSAYSNSEQTIKGLDRRKQYIISKRCKGDKIRMGEWMAYVSSARLPIRSSQEPR